GGPFALPLEAVARPGATGDLPRELQAGKGRLHLSALERAGSSQLSGILGSLGQLSQDEPFGRPLSKGGLVRLSGGAVRTPLGAGQALLKGHLEGGKLSDHREDLLSRGDKLRAIPDQPVGRLRKRMVNWTGNRHHFAPEPRGGVRSDLRAAARLSLDDHNRQAKPGDHPVAGRKAIRFGRRSHGKKREDGPLRLDAAGKLLMLGRINDVDTRTQDGKGPPSRL